MLAKHLFFKEKNNGCHFYFTEGLHIWEKQTDFPLNNKGVLINFAKTKGGVITREETEKYLDNLRLSKNIIISKIHDDSDSTFYFYTETTYVLSDYLQINDSFISKVKKALEKLFDNQLYIIPRDIDEAWFDTLPVLPMSLNWNLLLLQEFIKYNDEIGYKPITSEVEQSPYRISAAFIKTNANITLAEIVYIYAHNTIALPFRTETEKFRLMLRKAGFLNDSEWFTSMPKILNDPRFAFSNDNKMLLIRK
jgi:hypothetical protein